MKTHGYSTIEEFRGKLQPFIERKAQTGTPSISPQINGEKSSDERLLSFEENGNGYSRSVADSSRLNTSKPIMQSAALKRVWDKGVAALCEVKHQMGTLERVGLYTTVTVLLFALFQQHQQK